MVATESLADANRILLPLADSTIALSTTVKKGDTPNVTAVATATSPISLDRKDVEAGESTSVFLLVSTDFVDDGIEIVDGISVAVASSEGDPSILMV